MPPKVKTKKSYKAEMNSANANWTIHEKRQLLGALKTYGPNRMEKLQPFLPRKTPAEITRFIGKQKRKSELLSKGSGNRPKAPIEQWHYLAQDLIGFENFDYSTLLEKILSMAQDYEEHPSPEDAADPNYRLIYKFLAALFQSDELPEPLPPLEAAIILDLMHGLASKLKTLDTYSQQMIMKWKYSLLQLGQKAERTGYNPGKMKALLNDFSDFMPTHSAPMDGKTMKWVVNGLVISPRKRTRKRSQTNAPAKSGSDNRSILHPSVDIREEGKTVHHQTNNVVMVYPVYCYKTNTQEQEQTPPQDDQTNPDDSTRPSTETLTTNEATSQKSQNSGNRAGGSAIPSVSGSNKAQASTSQVNADKSPCRSVGSVAAHSDTDIVTKKSPSSKKSPISKKSPHNNHSSGVAQPTVSPSTGSTANMTDASVPSPKKSRKAKSLLETSDSRNISIGSNPTRQGKTKDGFSTTDKPIIINALNCSASKDKLKSQLRFDKPKLFTLNPFVIPSQFLNMKPVDLKKPFQIRKIEADQELRKQFAKAK